MSEFDVTTPVGCERSMARLITALTEAQQALAKARDKAVEAELTYKAARRAALLSDACPKVTRGGVTTAERDAWVDAACVDAERAYRILEATREAAQDRLRILRDDVSLLVTLSASTRTAYEVAGRGVA